MSEVPPCVAEFRAFKGWVFMYHNMQDGECIRCGLPEKDFRYFFPDQRDILNRPIPNQP